MKVHAPNACPSCGKRISAMQLLFGPERFAIKCAGCGERLVKRTRAIGLAIGGSLLVSSLARSYGYLSTEALVAFIALLLVVAFIASVTVSVSVAGPEIPDPPEIDHEAGRTRDGPPPVSSTFRGMSGPPERKD